MPMTIRMPRKGAAALRSLTARAAISTAATLAVAVAGQVLVQMPAPVAEPALPVFSDSGKISEPLHGSMPDDGIFAVRTSGPADLVQAFRLPLDLSGRQLVWAADLRESRPAVSLAAARSEAPAHNRGIPATVAVLPPSRPAMLAKATTGQASAVKPASISLAQAPARAEPTSSGFLGMRLPKIPFGDRVVQAVGDLGGSLSQMIGRS